MDRHALKDPFLHSLRPAPLAFLMHTFDFSRVDRSRRRRGGSSVFPRVRACLFLFLLHSALLKGAQVSEYDIKAAFLLNFTKFVEWKTEAFSDASSPLEICIMGPDTLKRSIDLAVEGEVINQRRLVVRRISEAPGPRGCQVLFISGENRDLRGILRQVGPGVLTVGDARNFIDSGGMIQFTVENRRVRFEIDRRIAENRGLQISSQLLKVARFVR